ncbi:MAG: glycosyl transferase family 28 [Bacteroidota bacterium]|nr:glycosyl transferase family 28 [Bacteroidota bacterium]
MKKSKKFTIKKQNPRVLVAPLDWGLGHSTRCIPIIKELILLGCDVYIVADKKTFSLLKKEFPGTVFLRYKGYEIEYSRQKSFFSLKLILQAPKIILRIIQEKRWLKKVIKRYSIDAVISDNRFGMYHKNFPSIYITHQLFIKTGNKFSEGIAQKIHYHFIKKYSCCWVPDEGKDGLAGELSHPKKMPGNVIYIGPVSRFDKIPDMEKVYDLLIIISGPEPQRTIFENNILEQLKTVDGNIYLIRGLPEESEPPENFKNITIKNHLPANELNEVFAMSKVVICRSGYTSVMDLTALQKKAILIPTPGQTEQEYLAKYLMEKGFFFSEKQNNFSIKQSLKKAATFHFKKLDFPKGEYKKTVAEFVNSLKFKNDPTH